MNFILAAIFSFSVLLGGIIGLVRFKKIAPSYYPFIYFLWLGCINEPLSVFLSSKGIHNILNNNIYVLFEGFFILWFFYSTHFLKRKTFYILILFLLFTWIAETFFMRTIFDMSIYYRILYSFVIVLLSIDAINQFLLIEKGNLLKSPVFLISMAFIIYFTFKILINAFWLYGLVKNASFILLIYKILIYINLFTNLVYALATLWIPKKQPSILQF